MNPVCWSSSLLYSTHSALFKLPPLCSHYQHSHLELRICILLRLQVKWDMGQSEGSTPLWEQIPGREANTWMDLCLEVSHCAASSKHWHLPSSQLLQCSVALIGCLPNLEIDYIGSHASDEMTTELLVLCLVLCVPGAVLQIPIDPPLKGPSRYWVCLSLFLLQEVQKQCQQITLVNRQC